MSVKFAIIVHGGASALPRVKDSSELLSYRDVVAQSAQAGSSLLQQGASAVDAVEAAVRILESNPLLNAGTGACLTSLGTVELDAMIMDGKHNRLGSVACTDCTDHPVSLARLVMEHSLHCFMVGEGARRFAESKGYKTLQSTESLITEMARQNLEEFGSYDTTLNKLMNVTTLPQSCDTVGAVALDVTGGLACATSTGGIVGKLPGRVGDCPLVGCGGFANTFGTAAATGHGEALMKAMCCRQVVYGIESGKSPYESIKEVLQKIYSETKSCGGVISLNSHGQIGVYHSSAFMPWASITSDAPLVTFYEDICHKITN